MLHKNKNPNIWQYYCLCSNIQPILEPTAWELLAYSLQKFSERLDLKFILYASWVHSHL